jgi:hypothetical protein
LIYAAIVWVGRNVISPPPAQLLWFLSGLIIVAMAHQAISGSWDGPPFPAPQKFVTTHWLDGIDFIKKQHLALYTSNACGAT